MDSIFLIGLVIVCIVVFLIVLFKGKDVSSDNPVKYYEEMQRKARLEQLRYEKGYSDRPDLERGMHEARNPSCVKSMGGKVYDMSPDDPDFMTLDSSGGTTSGEIVVINRHTGERSARWSK